MRTTDIQADTVSVELTEFELTALVALVERGQLGIHLDTSAQHDIRRAIHTVAAEFRSLLGHFELSCPLTAERC